MHDFWTVRQFKFLRNPCRSNRTLDTQPEAVFKCIKHFKQWCEKGKALALFAVLGIILETNFPYIYNMQIKQNSRTFSSKLDKLDENKVKE